MAWVEYRTCISCLSASVDLKDAKTKREIRKLKKQMANCEKCGGRISYNEIHSAPQYSSWFLNTRY